MTTSWQTQYEQIRPHLEFLSNIKPSDIVQVDEQRRVFPNDNAIGSIVSRIFLLTGWYTGTTQKGVSTLQDYVSTEVRQIGNLVDNIKGIWAENQGDTKLKEALTTLESALEGAQRGVLRHELISWGDSPTRMEFTKTSESIHNILSTLRHLNSEKVPTPLSPTSLPTVENKREVISLEKTLLLSIDGKPFEIATNGDIQKRFSALGVRLNSFVQNFDNKGKALTLKDRQDGKKAVELPNLKDYLGLLDFESEYRDLEQEYSVQGVIPNLGDILIFDGPVEANIFLCRFQMNILKGEIIRNHPELTSDELGQILANVLPWLTFNTIARDILTYASADAGESGCTPLIKKNEEGIQDQGESVISVLGKSKALKIDRIQQLDWLDEETLETRSSPVYVAEAIIPFDGSVATVRVNRSHM